MSRPLPTSVRRTRRDLQAPAALASRGPARLAAAWSLCRSRSQGPQRRTPRPSGPAFGAHTRRRLVELRAVGDVLALRRVVRRVVHELDRLGNHIRCEVLAGAAASPLGPRAPPARPQERSGSTTSQNNDCETIAQRSETHISHLCQLQESVVAFRWHPSLVSTRDSSAALRRSEVRALMLMNIRNVRNPTIPNIPKTKASPHGHPTMSLCP